MALYYKTIHLIAIQREKLKKTAVMELPLKNFLNDSRTISKRKPKLKLHKQQEMLLFHSTKVVKSSSKCSTYMVKKFHLIIE